PELLFSLFARVPPACFSSSGIELIAGIKGRIKRRYPPGHSARGPPAEKQHQANHDRQGHQDPISRGRRNLFPARAKTILGTQAMPKIQAWHHRDHTEQDKLPGWYSQL